MIKEIAFRKWAATLAMLLAVGCSSKQSPKAENKKNTPASAQVAVDAPANTPVLIAKPVAKPQSNGPAFLKNFKSKAFHKLTSGNQVVGKTSFEWKMDAGRLKFTENSEMRLTLFKKLQTISTDLDVWTNEKIQVQEFDFVMKSLEAVISIHGVRSGNILKLKVTQAGKVQMKDLSLQQEPILMSATIRPYLLMMGLPETNTKLEAVILEPSALVTVPMTMNLIKQNKDRWNVDISYLSHTLSSEIDAAGSLLKEKSDFAGLPVEGSPITEAEEKTLPLVGTKNDLVEIARVVFPPISSAQQNAKQFSVKISGIDFRTFELNRHRQKLNNDKLTVNLEPVIDTNIPVQAIVGQKPLATYLEGDTATPVYDPLIQKTARDIVQGETNLWKRAKLVQEFVFKTLVKVPTISIPNAIEVLQTKKGDCNEHAVLYTALARAVGVPTRTVVGLVYSDRFYGEPGFYYHAWVEVYNGKDWIAIDPTWNQIPADVTHIAFVEGGLDQQVQVTSLMGKIQLNPAAP